MKTKEQSATALIILGSPRKKGNSAALAAEIERGLADSGVMTKEIKLHGMNISPCRGCDHCQKAGAPGCVIKDDMQELYPLLKQASIIVYASAIYWFSVTAQLKLFMDRCYALATEDANFLKGKKMAVALAYGDIDPFTSGAVNALRMFQDAFKYLDARLVGSVYGSASEPGEIAENKDLMRKAYDLGKRLAEG
jgi:multimeric flavodoxin WrbA